jgi:hypothetical protein
MRAIRYVSLSIVLASVCGAGVALAMGRGNDHLQRSRPRLRAAALTQSNSMISAIPADQASAFAILRRPQEASDVLPEAQWERYETGLGGRLGLNPQLMRAASTQVGNVWVIPGNGYVCLSLAASSSPASLDGGGMGCNASSRAADGHLVSWTFFGKSRNQSIVQGLVPDGVISVTLTATNGASVTTPVSDNVYGTVLDGVFSAVTLNRPSGSVIAFAVN